MSRSREAQREYMRRYRANKRAERDAATAKTAPPAATPPPAPPAPSAPADAPDAVTPRHMPAVERMLRESGLGQSAEDGPLVELIKDLAADLDAGGGDRTRQQYLTALRDARRILAVAPGVSGVGGRVEGGPDGPVSDEPAVPEVDPEVADFASFRRAKGGAAQG